MNKKFNITKTGFKAPENYFESVEDSVFSKIKSENSLKSVKDSGYKIPEGYLDTVEENILNKLNNETKVVSLFTRKNLVYISGMAAAILILFAIFIKNNNPLTEELDYQVVEAYILEQDINTYELASLLTDEELSDMTLEIMDDAFDEEDMEDYLLENVNIEDIIEQ
jgi:hypothetical protein